MPHYKNKTARQSKGRADGMKLVLQISFIVRLLQVSQVCETCERGRRDELGSTRFSLSSVCFKFRRCAKLARGLFFVDGMNLVLRDFVYRPSAFDFTSVQTLREGQTG